MRIRKIIDIFSSFFVIVNENSQLNVVKGINKKDVGESSLLVGPVNDDSTFELSPSQILKNPIFVKQFCKSDIKLIKSLLMSEGDVFVTGKNYINHREVFSLQSLVNKDEWEMTKEELSQDKSVLSRLNIKYFSLKIDLK